jgi:hypothetical protein
MSFPLNPDADRLKKIVEDPATMGTVLYAVALRLFGAEIHEWEPEMFDMEFRDEIQAEVPAVNQDKLNALLTAIVTNRFYRDFLPFLHTCELLNGNEADFETLTPDLLPAEIAWAVIEVRLNDDDDPSFDPEVANFVGVVLDQFGFIHPPEPLQFASMPERYFGSTPGEDLDQMEVMETEHASLIGSYILDQSTTLVGQLKELPWATEGFMEAIDGELRKMSFHRSSLSAGQ